jgi:hypothetical protein
MNAWKTLLLLSITLLIGSPGCRQKEGSAANQAAQNPTRSTNVETAAAETNTAESPRMLPVQDSDANAADADANEEENGGEAEPLLLEETESPTQIAARAFAAPDGAKTLSKRNLWVDRDANRVYADGYIAMNDGPLEMFACPSGTKEHESIVATLAKASEIHAGLLAIGAQIGTPVTYDPAFVPATGQRIRVWVCYFDDAGKYQVTDARDWIVKIGTKETLTDDWVFAGSFIWTDPSDNRSYYQGDVGDMICVSNFTTAMMDIPVASSTDTDQLEYSPYTERIPNRGTPVRLILEPIPLLTDTDKNPAEPKPPTADVLKKQQ